MTLRAVTREGDRVSLYYRGSREDMLTLDMLTPEQLDPWKVGTPKGKRDRDGDRMWVRRQAVVRAGVPTIRYEVTLREKLIARVEHLPGVVEAISLARADDARQEAHWYAAAADEGAPVRQSSFHLIVESDRTLQ
jgi:hypothetical protein